MMKKWKIIILTILGIWVLSLVLSHILKDDDFDTSDKIVVIPLYGVLAVTDSRPFLFSESTLSSDFILESLEKADKDPTVKGILLEINSPGGTPVASEEIANKVKSIRKPVVSFIRETGASGAYWVASASDKIVADPLAITGSIGVLASYLEFSGLMEKYGVRYEKVNAGEFKDLGNPYEKLTERKRKVLQAKIDLIQDRFVQEVAQNRNLSELKVKEIASGLFYLGTEAKDLGLVDELGDKELALSITKELAGIEEAKTVTIKKKITFFDLFSDLQFKSFYYLGQGIGSVLTPSSGVSIEV